MIPPHPAKFRPHALGTKKGDVRAERALRTQILTLDPSSSTFRSYCHFEGGQADKLRLRDFFAGYYPIFHVETDCILDILQSLLVVGGDPLNGLYDVIEALFIPSGRRNGTFVQSLHYSLLVVVISIRGPRRGTFVQSVLCELRSSPLTLHLQPSAHTATSREVRLTN